MDNIQGGITPTQPRIPDEFASIMDSSIIAYERINDGFRMSVDGIVSLNERLHQSLPGLLISIAYEQRT